jgi:hypothetical protein
MAGFEPATSATQTPRANQAALHPDESHCSLGLRLAPRGQPFVGLGLCLLTLEALVSPNAMTVGTDDVATLDLSEEATGAVRVDELRYLSRLVHDVVEIHHVWRVSLLAISTRLALQGAHEFAMAPRSTSPSAGHLSYVSSSILVVPVPIPPSRIHTETAVRLPDPSDPVLPGELRDAFDQPTSRAFPQRLHSPQDAI